MKKALRDLVVAVPVLLFLIGANMSFVMDSSGTLPLENSSFLDYISNNTFVGSVFSPLFFFVVFSFLGLFLYLNSENKASRNLGKAFYGIAVIQSYNSFVVMYRNYNLNVAGNTTKMALGANLMLGGVIIGLIILIAIIIAPLAKETLKVSFNFNGGGVKKNIDFREELRAWKALQNEKAITKEEYDNLKKKTLDKVKVRKDDALGLITNLKEIVKEELISIDDFNEIKAKIIS